MVFIRNVELFFVESQRFDHELRTIRLNQRYNIDNVKRSWKWTLQTEIYYGGGLMVLNTVTTVEIDDQRSNVQYCFKQLWDDGTN